MPEIPSVTSVLVTADYRSASGGRLYGTVTFTPSALGTVDDGFVLPRPVEVRVVNGTLAVSLAASDDPDLSPNGFVYEVTEDFGGPLSKYEITITAAMAPTVELAAIAPPEREEEEEPPPTGVTFVSTVNGAAGHVVLTKSTVGLGNVDNTSDAAKPISTATQAALNAKQATLPSGTTSQFLRGDHTFASITKSSVGLGNVDNTSDATKPISAATQSALNAKQNTLPSGTASQFLRGSDKTFVAVTKSDVGLGSVDNTSDANKPVSTAAQTALNTKVGKGDIFINVRDWPGIAYDGLTDDSVAFRQLLDSIPAAAGNEIGGVCLWFPKGVMLLNTPDGDGWLASIKGKANVTLAGAGNGARIRTSSATAEGILLVQDSTLFTMRDILLQVIGTARVKYGAHYTVSSPGSAHEGRFTNVKASCNGAYRKAYDFTTTASSTTVYSAQAAFASGDVGGVLMLNLPSGPLFTGITAVNTLSATLAADVTTTSQTTLTLNAALPGAPASGFTIKVGTERMFVSAGGNTTTLTVTRGRGPDLVRTTHSTGAAVVTYSATLADAPADTVTNAAVMGRIQPSGSAVMQYGVAVAASPTGVGDLDVANTILDKVSVNRAAVAGVRVGNGTAGNVLDQYAYGLSTAECAIGMYTHGGSLSVYGGQCSVNLIDIRRQVAPSSPVVIDGLRSEDAGMFYEMTGQATAGPSTTIRNVEVALMHAEDGVAIRHLHSGALHLEQVSIKASDVAANQVAVVASGTSSFPCHLTVINFATSGGNLDPFSTSVAPATIKTILNAPRMLVPSRQVFANATLGTYFGNRVQLAGGLVRGRTAVADANYTVLQTDTVVAYTSLTAARAVTLPAQSAALLVGQEFTIKDESGSCDGTKTITVSPPAGTIDGAANVVLNSAYAKVSLYTNGTNWFTR